MKLHYLCDLFSSFNPTAQKAIPFPKWYYGNIGSESGHNRAMWESLGVGGNVSSFWFHIHVVCVCAPVYKLLSSYSVLPILLMAVFLVCIFTATFSRCPSLCPNDCLNHFQHISRMLCTLLRFFVRLGAVTTLGCEYVLVIAMWLCVMGTHFYHLAHCLRITWTTMWEFGTAAKRKMNIEHHTNENERSFQWNKRCFHSKKM